MTSRIIGFSDAVFAIAATIKVIPIKIKLPVENLSEEMQNNLFPIMLYFLCFFVTTLVWENHVILFDRIGENDEVVAWLNLLLLLLVTFIPYPLTVLGDFYKDRNAVLLNFITFAMIASVQTLLVMYTNRKKALLSDAFKSMTFEHHGHKRRHQVATTAAVTPTPNVKQSDNGDDGDDHDAHASRDIGDDGATLLLGNQMKSQTKSYTRWHDFSIITRIWTLPTMLLLAYAVAWVDWRAAFVVLPLILIAPPVLLVIERRIFGLEPLTKFLSSEMAMDRMMCFSDGVYSIAMTLLILDIADSDYIGQQEHTDSGSCDNASSTDVLSDSNVSVAVLTVKHILHNDLNKYAAYAVSYIIVAIEWSVNTTIVGSLRNIDDVMRFLIVASLSVAGFGPFFGSLLIEYRSKKPDADVAVHITTSALFAMSMLQLALWVYACNFKPAHHLSEAIQNSRSLKRAISIKASIMPLFMLLAFVLSYIAPDDSYVSFSCSITGALVAIVVHSYVFLDKTRLKAIQPRLGTISTTPHGGQDHDDDNLLLHEEKDTGL
eukprot:m.202403 g.202403  ORF g.202403 m.202403 type:complete len:546 (-) comp32825_c0_seq1:51-1688(-)